MKAVILAGGFGTRLSEETHLRPKPMVEIGGRPIIFHIMDYLANYGIKDFIICCGYKGYSIKEYFLNFHSHNSDVKVNLSDGSFEVLQKHSVDWNVTLVDTGLSSMTGGRLGRVKDLLVDEEMFLFTYGDGLCDINIHDLLAFHKNHGKAATVSAVYPPGRFGALEIQKDGVVSSFVEKPEGDGGRINGGYFVLNPKVIDHIENDQTVWEQEPLRTLAENGDLYSYEHDGNWHAMDTLRDKEFLEKQWKSGKAFWKVN
jgi:glucose-1-phosphate cytidylyltransferase